MTARVLSKEYLAGKRMGEQFSNLQYLGATFTAADGTVWKANNGFPIPYTNSYRQLLSDEPAFVSSGVLLGGNSSLDEMWTGNMACSGIAGPSSGGATWMTSARVNGLPYYYTSTNAGTTWTARTPPFSAFTASTPFWDGTNYILYGHSLTTNGVYESTDAATWTSRTGISLSGPTDMIYNGSVYVVVQTATGYATSADRTTWTSRTLSFTPAGAPTPCVGSGIICWHSGASLFLMGASSAPTNSYYTSPDAITWTARTSLDSDIMTHSAGFVRFASDGTTVIGVGFYGVVAVGTNGTSWTKYMIDTSFDPTTVSPTLVFHDGTRFVVVYSSGLVFYSTTGTSWTRNFQATCFGASTIIRTPTGICSGNTTKRVMVTDVTDTTPRLICSPAPSQDSTNRIYSRVR